MSNLLLIATLVLALSPQEVHWRAFEKGKHLYSVEPPQGWKWDEQAYSEVNRRAVFRPVEPDSLGVERTVSVDIIVKPNRQKGVFARILQQNIGDVKKKFEGLTVSDRKSIAVLPKKMAVAKQLMNRSSNIYLAIAYIDEPEYVGIVILRSNDESSFFASSKAFESVVKSFRVTYEAWRINEP